MADKIIVVEKKRGGGCGCLFALAIAGIVGALIWGWGKSEQREIEKRVAFDDARNSRPATTPAKPPAPDSSALPGWRIASRRDEMTDKMAYYFALDGLRVSDGLVEYVPRLIIKAVAKSVDPLQYSTEAVVRIETEGMARNAQKVVYRFGRSEAVTATLKTSTDRHSVFLPDGALQSLDGAPTFALRFTTTLGDVRTLRFTTQGFTLANFERELVRQIRSSK